MNTNKNLPTVITPVKRAFKRSQSGFSLNEILVATAIMGSVAAVGAPYFGDMLQAGDSMTAKAAASQLVAYSNIQVANGIAPATDCATIAPNAGITDGGYVVTGTDLATCDIQVNGISYYGVTLATTSATATYTAKS